MADPSRLLKPKGLLLTEVVIGGGLQMTSKDIYGYLESLPPITLEQLYKHPAACMAVFQTLPVLARHYILRSLFLNSHGGFLLKDMLAWVHPDKASDHRDMIARMAKLRISISNETSWVMNPEFKEGLKRALCGCGDPWNGQISTGEHSKDAASLEEYSKTQWEGVLQFMVAANSSGVTQEIVSILLEAGLIGTKIEGEKSIPTITNKGFQFLLQDSETQVWYYLTQYLDNAQKTGLDIVEMLSLLFQISFATLGMEYPIEGLTESQLSLLQHLRGIGLVYRRNRTSKRYFPTPLAVNLINGISKSQNPNENKGYIIVETNFRVYAYTNSELQIALLGLFIELRYRFPNMVCGLISRDSVRKALVKGITANQMIKFLKAHAHPQARVKTPPVPETICDQIRLWERERNRFVATPAVLYDTLTLAEFTTIHAYANDCGVELGVNPLSKTIVVTPEGHETVKKFWQEQQQLMQQKQDQQQQMYQQQLILQQQRNNQSSS